MQTVPVSEMKLLTPWSGTSYLLLFDRAKPLACHLTRPLSFITVLLVLILVHVKVLGPSTANHGTTYIFIYILQYTTLI